VVGGGGCCFMTWAISSLLLVLYKGALGL